MDRPVAKNVIGSDDEMVDIDESTIPVVTEIDVARYIDNSGRRVVRHRGRFWQETNPGFFRPVHPLARLTAGEATRPTMWCWGFHACLAESDASHANGSAPVYLVSDLGGFDEEQLTASRRYKLRKARRRARLVQLTGPAVLREQGYDVLRSSHGRTGYGVLPTEQAYLKGLDRFHDPSYGFVFAGMVDGRLGGYITGYAVDGTAYVGDVVIATDALSTHVSTGLTYEFIHACRRSRQIHELVHGWHTPENEGLCRYKDWLGLPLRRLPARIGLLPGTGQAVRLRSRERYYRLTGHA